MKILCTKSEYKDHEYLKNWNTRLASIPSVIAAGHTGYQSQTPYIPLASSCCSRPCAEPPIIRACSQSIKHPAGLGFDTIHVKLSITKHASVNLLCWIIDSAWGLWQINCSIVKTIFFCAFMHTAYPMATSSVLDCHNLCINVSNQHFLVLNLL